MKKSNTNSKKGFTIIEVVLVLAIAGLIFLMVFVALPNLQRTQRDTQRRDDVARLSTALTQFVTNNNRLPNDGEALKTDTDEGAFVTNYLLAGGDTFNDPSNDIYYLNLIDAQNADANRALADANAGATVGGMTIVTNATCGDTEGTYTYKRGNRNFAVIAKLEGAGSYCTNN